MCSFVVIKSNFQQIRCSIRLKPFTCVMVLKERFFVFIASVLRSGNATEFSRMDVMFTKTIVEIITIIIKERK